MVVLIVHINNRIANITESQSFQLLVQGFRYVQQVRRFVHAERYGSHFLQSGFYLRFPCLRFGVGQIGISFIGKGKYVAESFQYFLLFITKNSEV